MLIGNSLFESMNYLFFFTALVLIVIVIICHMLFTVKKIRIKRQTGKDIRQKNSYYKFVSFMFLKNLPR